MPRLKLSFRSWTSADRCLPGQVYRWARWGYCERGALMADRGFGIFRSVAAASSKPGGSWVHQHTDGTEYPWYHLDTALYPETGSDSPVAFATGLTSTWQPSVVAFPETVGLSVFLNGTNGEARGVRVESGNLDDVLFDLAQPDANWTATGATTGGSLAAGSYNVRIAQLDDDGNVTAISAPATAKTGTVASGSTGKITVDQSTWTPDTRATKWRIAWTAVGGADTPSAYVYSADVAIGTTTYDITNTTTAGSQAFADRNGTYRQATMPLSSVDFGVEHRGRLIIFSKSSDEFYWSERGAPNHWYSTNRFSTGVEQNLNGGCRWALSIAGALYVGTADGVYLISGDFSRDSEGTNPTYAPQVFSDPIPGSSGGVAHNAAVAYGGAAYYLSTEGPAVVAGLNWRLLDLDNVKHEWRCLDWDNMDRASGALDPRHSFICWAVPRATNSSRPLDGASVSGTPDLILRWDAEQNLWQIPLQLDVTHLSRRKNGTKGGTSDEFFLMAMNPGGYAYQMNKGWSGGGPADISGTSYNGVLASSSTATTATFTMSGIVADQFNGMAVTLRYHDTDTNFPGLTAQKTITDTAVAGSTVTITWQGSLTTPSSTEWTVRIAGLQRAKDWLGAVADHADLEPGSEVQIRQIVADLVDMAGMEAVS